MEFHMLGVKAGIFVGLLLLDLYSNWIQKQLEEEKLREQAWSVRWNSYARCESRHCCWIVGVGFILQLDSFMLQNAEKFPYLQLKRNENCLLYSIFL